MNGLWMVCKVCYAHEVRGEETRFHAPLLGLVLCQDRLQYDEIQSTKHHHISFHTGEKIICITFVQSPCQKKTTVYEQRA